MANLQDTTINTTGYLNLPSNAGTNTGANGQLRYNILSNNIEYYDSKGGGQWATLAIPWAARNIQTVGYQHGGYAASVTFRNTNKMNFATDVMTDLGTAGYQETSHNYQSGGFNNRYCYVWGASGAHCTASNATICFDMVAEVAVTNRTLRTFPYSIINSGTIQNDDWYAYIAAGTNNIYEFNFITDTLNTGTTYGSANAGTIWGASTENFGIFYGGGDQLFYYSTRTLLARGSNTGIAGDGYEHNMQTRKAYTIAGREGNYSTNWRLTNYQNNASYNAIGAKPAPSGEENMLSAREWGFCAGFYVGSHVLTTYKVNYTTWSGATTGTTSQPKGMTGNSSAVDSWRP